MFVGRAELLWWRVSAASNIWACILPSNSHPSAFYTLQRQILETFRYGYKQSSTASSLICQRFSSLIYSWSCRSLYSVSRRTPFAIAILMWVSVGWTGPFPVLCRKRPTASLVSRKVLTPLLGQIAICILIQAVGFQAVRRQPWWALKTRNSYIKLISNRFIPPHLDREKSNVENSENTTLFLISCYEYILSGIVLSVGPPFRQSMGQNCKSPSTISNCHV